MSLRTYPVRKKHYLRTVCNVLLPDGTQRFFMKDTLQNKDGEVEIADWLDEKYAEFPTATITTRTVHCVDEEKL